mmetsp:Transcript_13321/g.33260  ORF Transcript_13321/g.33260 Transcript_13321/m.33260 type:complete len:174 (+) Transcript_13321:265-786(+)
MATTTTVQEHIMAAPVPMTTTKHLGLGMPRVESSTFSLSQLLNAHNSDDDAATSKAPQAKPQLYRLVRVEDDGDTARLATPADVDDLLSMLGPDVDPRSISPIPTPIPVVPPQTPSTRRVPLAGAYKPGGPCNHCGATESPQWRRGPPSKPCLCNACGTRYRRSHALPAATAY